MKKYYTSEEIEKGVGDLPPISRTTLNNLRSARKIQYSKIGNKCVYTIEWIEDYLRKNMVECSHPQYLDQFQADKIWL